MKKNYRPVMYHNWRHAFNVAQTMFTILKVWVITLIVYQICSPVTYGILQLAIMSYNE